MVNTKLSWIVENKNKDILNIMVYMNTQLSFIYYFNWMVNIFSYVKYSEASFPMTGQYTALLLLTSVIWVLLWLGYRQNKINDEIKKKEKEERINAKTERRRKLESLYPNKKSSF